MSAARWIPFLAAVAVLACALAGLSSAGRLYRDGRGAEAARRARTMGVLSLSLGVAVLAAGLEIATRGPAHPWLGGIGLSLLVLASVSGGLGGLSRKPLPSAQVAWALFAAGSLALGAAVLL